MQNYDQYIVEKKTKSEQTSNNVRHAESYDVQGFNEHGQRFRYRTTRSMRNNSENNNTSSETQQHPEITASRQRWSESWGNEATIRRRSRHNRTRIRGIEKRRQVYAFNLRACSTFGPGKQRSRNISSQFFKTYQGCTHRLIPWLARDLRVLLGNNEEEVNFLIEFILSLITRIDMDSVEFLEELRPFLLQTAEHFVHELLSFAKAPFDMTAYDECVVYPWPEESSRATIPHDGANMNEERGGHSSPAVNTQPITESTPLSRCAWSDTPAGLHQVSRVLDSPVPHSESLRPVEINQVIEISDSTEESERLDDESRKPTEYSQNIICEGYGENAGPGLDEYQSSPTRESLSEVVQRDNSTGREELISTEKHTADGAEHVHRHIHKHLHKHKHRHRHKHKHGHKHKFKHKRENEHEHRHKRKNKHRYKIHEQKMHRVTSPKSKSTSDDDVSVGGALPCVSAVEIHATQPSSSEIETSDIGQAHSPKLEEMRKEIDELNVLIQQHEEQLLSLTKRTES